MQYAEAVKKVKAEKPKDNFLVVHIDAWLVMPHKDGILLIQALANAEKFPRYSYSDPKYIEPLELETITSSSLSHQDYESYKVAALLGVSFNDVKEMAARAVKGEQPEPAP